eukprot:TRINITY_DN28974_c0_g1_i1.p1 TRINITY_DN28974_c0_g1~~TRINITY_DN28974_c0_g1_i1.p1  ORF type:complete len:430 (-),score=59.69 TRINITY_DN28974_c0_g1_i1:498-1787(-)
MAPVAWASSIGLTVAAAQSWEAFVPPPHHAELGATLTNSAPGVRGGPTLAQSWTATLLQKSPMGDGHGKMFYDVARQRWRMKYCTAQTIFHPDGKMCLDELSNNAAVGSNKMNMSVGQGDDAICKVFPYPYYDILMSPVLANATLTGEKKTVDGVTCEVWHASASYPGSTMTISSCIASDGVPREHNVSTGMAYKAAATQNYVFSQVILGKPDDALFEPYEVCVKDYPKPACANSTVEKFDVYRTRSAKEPNSLSNRNVGDALGDMAFFCGLGGMDETQVITRWAVEASTAWGQYAYCLYSQGKNICMGNTGKQIGRQSAEGLGEGPVQGQCSPNNDTGSWFSFPEEGQCAPGAKVGDDGCTWRATPLRTVSAACVLHGRGLQQACEQERGHAPLLRSAAIFEAALASADPAKGGCPDVEDYGLNSLVV